MTGCYYTDEEIADMDAQLAEVVTERNAYEAAIDSHNTACQNLCGVGEQEAERCGYRPYFLNNGRRCPDCPVYDMIEKPCFADKPDALLRKVVM